MHLRALNGTIRDWRSQRRGSSLMTMIHAANSREIGYRGAATAIAIHRLTASRVTYRSVCTAILSVNLAFGLAVKYI